MGNTQLGASGENKERIAAKISAKRSAETEVEALRRQLAEAQARAAQSDARAARLQEERDGLFPPLGEALQHPIFSKEGNVPFSEVSRRTKSARVTGMSSLAKEHYTVRTIVPADVLPWDKFDEEMSLAANAKLTEPKVPRVVFEAARTPADDEVESLLVREAGLSSAFHNRVLTPLRDNSDLGSNVVLLEEASDSQGHRADYDWLVQDENAPRNSLGRRFASMFIKKRATASSAASLEARNMTLALRHEHKASGLFPVDPSLGDEDEKGKKGKKGKKKVDKVHVYNLPKFWRMVIERAPDKVAQEKAKKARSSSTERDADDVTDEEASWNVVAGAAYPICQIFTYMVRRKIRFGVLSTTVATWFLKWDGKGNLYASSPRQAVHDGLKSTKLAYYSILKRLVDEPSLAVADNVVVGTTWYEREFLQRIADANALEALVGGSVAPLPAPVGGGRWWRYPRNVGGARGGGGDEGKPFPTARRSLSIPGLGSDGDVEVFTVGRLARVARRTAHGEDMVVKTRMWYEDETDEEVEEEAIDSFEREMDALERLAELEGTVIPRVLHMGPYGVADIIVTSYEGEDLEHAFRGVAGGRTIPEWARKSALEALRAVHEKGVLHQDVALRNFVVDAELQRVKVIDFGRAAILPEYDAPAMRHEEARLERLLEQGCDDAW